MINSGKRFEQQWKDSIPPNVFFYRFRDGTSSWGNQENTRFQQSNMCDCMMFDGKTLYLLELKSHKGKSLPFSAIRQNQIDELIKAKNYPSIESGFVINFSDLGETYYCLAEDVSDYIKSGARKSIPIDWCKTFGYKILGKLKKVNYIWDIQNCLIGV